MRDKTLASIDQNLIDTGEFLKEFVADHKKLECLQTFARCLPVVQWIRKETKGLKIFFLNFHVISGFKLLINCIFVQM